MENEFLFSFTSHAFLATQSFYINSFIFSVWTQKGVFSCNHATLFFFFFFNIEEFFLGVLWELICSKRSAVVLWPSVTSSIGLYREACSPPSHWRMTFTLSKCPSFHSVLLQVAAFLDSSTTARCKNLCSPLLPSVVIRIPAINILVSYLFGKIN